MGIALIVINQRGRFLVKGDLSFTDTKASAALTLLMLHFTIQHLFSMVVLYGIDSQQPWPACPSRAGSGTVLLNGRVHNYT